ncbi:MAG: NitT/TauT family transport system permease protein [Variibacter sp.]|nr:NitT/TauT family transport system permease protein [Variibacter sp.]
MTMAFTRPAGMLERSPSARRRSLLSRVFQEPPYLGWSVGATVLLIGSWEAGTWLFQIPPVILPPPSLIAQAFWKYATTGSMFNDIRATFWRVFAGLVIGGGAGVVIGLLMGWYGKVRAALQPLIASTFPIPKIALLPLLMIWFGMGDAFKIALVAIGVFYIILVNTMAGVAGMSRTTILAVQNLGANDFQLLYKAVLPAAFPVIMAGIRIAYSIALVLVIAAEMVLSRDGIGSFLVSSGQILDVESIFAGLAVTALMGVVGYAVLDVVERVLLPFRRAQGS